MGVIFETVSVFGSLYRAVNVVRTFRMTCRRHPQGGSLGSGSCAVTGSADHFFLWRAEMASPDRGAWLSSFAFWLVPVTPVSFLTAFSHHEDAGSTLLRKFGTNLNYTVYNFSKWPPEERQSRCNLEAPHRFCLTRWVSGGGLAQ